MKSIKQIVNFTRPRIHTPLTHLLRLLAAFYLCCIPVSCGPKSTRVVGTPPSNYNLDKPRVLRLTPLLNEISGLCYYPKDASIFSIVDEDGYLYKLFPYRPDSMFRWRFSGHGDYEDLTLIDSTFFILQSNGNIVACVIRPGADVVTTEYQFPEKKKEFEILYYDPQLRQLILVCKDCGGGKRDLHTYSFDPVTRQYSPGPFKINMHEIAVIVGENSMAFKPSAAAIHPLTGDLYIVSSINKLLVVVARDGVVKQAYPLSPKLYKQPEGLAFSPDGTLFISNEFAKNGAPNIFIIPYRPTRKR